MSFLTPLYIAGIAAVALPVFFHMIRRTPRGRVLFSTLLFLSPSPPRVTRRSRLDNWPLLLLRALALCLIAAAFARPFFRQEVTADLDENAGRNLAVLIDTSASMQRDDLWRQAVERAEQIIDEAKPVDRLVLYTFDRRLTPVLTSEEWKSLEPAARTELAKQRLAKIKPGWGDTHLGRALIDAADALLAVPRENDGSATHRANHVVLISDLQAGSRLEALSAHAWPGDVQVNFSTVRSRTPTNAGLHVLESTPTVGTTEAGVASRGKRDGYRVAVSNAADSVHGEFRLRWSHLESETGDAIGLHVPPGQTRIVHVPLPPAGAASRAAPDRGNDVANPFGQTLRLQLEGDGHEFDNVAYFQPQRPTMRQVAYFGTTESPSWFYVSRAFPETPQRQVEVTLQEPAAPLLLTAVDQIDLAVVDGVPAEKHLKSLRAYAEAGGTLVWLLAPAAEIAHVSRALFDTELTGAEAEPDEYAMLTEIDFSHPLFAQFDDPRFADFTKIRFWKHRQLPLERLPESTRTLAQFDDGHAAITEIPLGLGRCYVFASGWHPDDSELCLSTKFVPLVNTLLNLHGRNISAPALLTVGDVFPLRAAKPNTDDPGETIVRLPDDSRVTLASAEGQFKNTVLPGVYRVTHKTTDDETDADASHFAVNLAAEESETTPLDVEHLESLGVTQVDGDYDETVKREREQRRQLAIRQLEQRQKIWRWLIVAAIGILLLETWLAGRQTRRGLQVASRE